MDERDRLSFTKQKGKRGFSLVELSIVLVILGLLTGGILSGQSLIRAAELRSIGTDYDRFVSAFYTFRDRYYGLPGDLRNATKFWGTGTCPRNAPDNVAKIVTCDGGGDGVVLHDKINTCNSPFTDPSCYQEEFRFWQHLANAGLIEGAYSGVDGPLAGPQDVVPGLSNPSGRMSSTAWRVRYNVYGTYWGTAKPVVNSLEFGYATTGGLTTTLTPSEMWTVDTKMDDGEPARGRIYSLPQHTGCIAGTTVDTAAYRLEASSKGCMIYADFNH